MRTRILLPIMILLAVFCGALGVAVYTNIAASTSELTSKQLGDRLNIFESKIVQAQEEGGPITVARLQDLVMNLSVSDGGLFVVNKEGRIIADSQQVMLETSVAAEGWYQRALQGTTDTFAATYGQAPVTARSFLHNDELFVSYVSNQSISAFMVTPLYVIGVVGLVSIIVIGLISYFLIARLLIDPLESLSQQIVGYTKGKPIALKPLAPCPEIASTARKLNALLKSPPDGESPPEPLTEEGASSVVSEEDTLAVKEKILALIAQNEEAAASAATPVQETDSAAGLRETAPAQTPEETAPEPAVDTPVPEPASQTTPETAVAPSAPETTSIYKPQDFYNDFQIPEAAPAMTYDEALLEAKRVIVNFDLTDLLRKVFEGHKNKVIAKKFKFSLLMGNDIPQNLRGDVEEITEELNSVFLRAFNKAPLGSTINAEMSLLPSAYQTKYNGISIVFSVVYDGQSNSVVLEAQGGVTSLGT